MNLPISLKEVPFFRLLLPLVAGIAYQYWLRLLSYSWVNVLLLLILLGTVFISYFLASKWHLRWLFGLSLSLFLFFTGAQIATKQPVSNKLVISSSNSVVLRLLDNPQQRTKSIRAEVEVKFLRSNNTWFPLNEKMLVYFDINDSSAVNLSYGSLLAADIIPQPVLQTGNPNQFNYKQYLSNRGVNLTSYIKQNSWIKTGYEGNAIKNIALRLREKLLSLFRSNSLSGDELAVASALTLGYQDLLDDELRQVYSSSGAMHILSVSGLHVGVLYVLLSFLLSFMNKNVVTRAVKTIILLTFLWFFALLTGLAPCVQRSALMFSFIVVGDFFMKKSNIYNALASSAFVLLVINPYNLFDVGFQLSYLAIISIVFFYPYVYKLVDVSNKQLDKVWSLIAVSIAAQIGTFGISLFYFNQFPNYFILGNLIAIPLSTIALYLSVLLIIVSPFSAIAHYVGIVFACSIRLLNSGLALVEKLPYSLSEGIHISSLQVFILFVALILISIYLINKRYRYLFSTLALLCLFLTINLFNAIQRANSKEFIVYNINKKSLISFRDGQNLVFVDVDTTKEKFDDRFNFYLKGYISAVGANKNYTTYKPSNSDKGNKMMIKYQSNKGMTLMEFRGKKIAVLFDNNSEKLICNHPSSVDYLIVNKFSYDKKLLSYFKPKLVIIDSSTSKKTITNTILECTAKGIPYYITSSQGAFILNLTNT